MKRTTFTVILILLTGLTVYATQISTKLYLACHNSRGDACAQIASKYELEGQIYLSNHYNELSCVYGVLESCETAAKNASYINQHRALFFYKQACDMNSKAACTKKTFLEKSVSKTASLKEVVTLCEQSNIASICYAAKQVKKACDLGSPLGCYETYKNSNPKEKVADFKFPAWNGCDVDSNDNCIFLLDWFKELKAGKILKTVQLQKFKDELNQRCKDIISDSCSVARTAGFVPELTIRKNLDKADRLHFEREDGKFAQPGLDELNTMIGKKPSPNAKKLPPNDGCGRAITRAIAILMVDKNDLYKHYPGEITNEYFLISLLNEPENLIVSIGYRNGIYANSRVISQTKNTLFVDRDLHLELDVKNCKYKIDPYDLLNFQVIR